MSDLHDYLAEQETEGVHDSSGRVTLDWVRAQKLQTSSLESPNQWVLKICQALVQQGAIELQIYSENSGLGFYWRLPTDQTSHQVAQDFTPAARSQVEIGIGAYQHLLKSAAQACYFDRSGSPHPLLGSHSALCANKRPDDYHGLVFQTSRSWMSFGKSAEMKLLSEFCQASPTPITLDGEHLVQSLSRARQLPVHYIQWSDDSAEFFHMPIQSKILKRPLRELASQGLATSPPFIWATLEQSNASWSESRWVIDGVLTPWHRNTLDRPGWSVTVDACDLTTDLSGLAVVDNKTSVQRMRDIQAWLATKVKRS